MQVTDDFRLDPMMKGPPRAGVILLHEPAPFQPAAAGWAVRVPAAAFIGLQCLKDASSTVFRETECALLARAELRSKSPRDEAARRQEWLAS
jgi:hypothetical protein